jgi:hypothetical protein
MKKLGDMLLPDGLQWTDRHDWSPVAQEVARTISGAQVVFCAAITGGRPVTLAAEEGVAWLSLAVVEELSSMAAQPGAAYLLEWEESSLLVMFRHHDPPPISVVPIWPHHELFTGTIRLMTV